MPFTKTSRTPTEYWCGFSKVARSPIVCGSKITTSANMPLWRSPRWLRPGLVAGKLVNLRTASVSEMTRRCSYNWDRPFSYNWDKRWSYTGIDLLDCGRINACFAIHCHLCPNTPHGSVGMGSDPSYNTATLPPPARFARGVQTCTVVLGWI